MPEELLARRVPIESWFTWTLRVTAFPQSPEPNSDQDWWRDLVGEAPETRTVNTKTGEQQDLGLFQGNQLLLITSPGIIDWRLLPVLEGVPPAGVPSAGQLPDSLRAFAPTMTTWLKDYCPELQRLAFGAELHLPVEDQAGGYRQLDPYIPVEIDPEQSSDLLYQINRPRVAQSQSTHLRINRLSRWSVAKFAYGQQRDGLKLSLPGLDSFACRVELDINTAPDYTGGFSREQIGNLFDELVGLATEIVIAGDIA